MATGEPEVVTDYKSVLGEGPVWMAETQTILWLDITEKNIHRFNIPELRHSVFNVGEMIGCMVPRAQGGLVAALKNGFAFIDVEQQLVEHIADPEHIASNRYNDGKCDAAGRFWAGTMSLSEEEGQGNLYVMETDLSTRKMLEGVSISNGIAWNADSTVMYYINTPTNYVFAFDFNLEDGTIHNQRVAIDLTHETGYADGMTIDSEGMLWIAFFGGWRVARYNPETGGLLRQVALPVENVSCCTFGGPALNDLYITTSGKDMREEDLEKQPLAGCLFVLKNCGCTGLLPYPFKG